jgi:arginine exporter protein ArgO
MWRLGWVVIVVSLGTFYLVGATQSERRVTGASDWHVTFAWLSIIFFALVASGGAWLVQWSKFTGEQRRNAAKMKAHQRDFRARRVR